MDISQSKILVSVASATAFNDTNPINIKAKAQKNISQFLVEGFLICAIPLDPKSQQDFALFFLREIPRANSVFGEIADVGRLILHGQHDELLVQEDDVGVHLSRLDVIRAGVEHEEASPPGFGDIQPAGGPRVLHSADLMGDVDMP